MKTCSLLVLLLISPAAARAQAELAVSEKFEPPRLNVVKTITLSPSYSCRPAEEFRKGYQKTALFLSVAARRYNSPDLLFNGACGSEDTFQSATHGANSSVVADLGPVPLENAPPVESLLAEPEGEAANAQSRFKPRALVKVGHTYAVRLDKRIARGWFVFTVTNHVPNKSVEIRYAVREYRLGESLNPPAARHEDAGGKPGR